MIHPLQRLSHADSARFGGKAATLGELCALGFRVPAGFAIAATDTSASAKGMPSDGPIELSADCIREIWAAFEDIDVPAVAVRSSATVEDTVARSFAGVFESYLGVERNDLITAILA